MKALYKYRFVLISVLALFAMLKISCGIAQARGPVPTATPMPTATPTPTPKGWNPGEEYQPTSTEKVKQIWQSLAADPESGYAGHELDNWKDTKEVILALTKDADRESILKAWPEDVKLQIIEVKYTWRELDAVREEINENWHRWTGKNEEENILLGAGINARENYVEVHIDRLAPEKIRKKVISDMFERYGDCIRIDTSKSAEEFEKGITDAEVEDYQRSFNLINTESYNYIPDESLLTFTDYTNNRGAYRATPRGVVIALAVGLGAVILVLAYVLRRQNLRVAATADGREVVSGTYSDEDIEALAKSAGDDVSDFGREKIFAAYEKERNKG